MIIKSHPLMYSVAKAKKKKKKKKKRNGKEKKTYEIDIQNRHFSITGKCIKNQENGKLFRCE